MDGLFQVVERLYNVQVKEDSSAPSYHDVRFFRITEQGKPIAGFYLDLYAREGKRGAWMADCRVRRKTENGVRSSGLLDLQLHRASRR